MKKRNSNVSEIIAGVISILKNELKDADQFIDKATKELPTMIDRGMSIVLQERLQVMKEQAQQPVPST